MAKSSTSFTKETAPKTGASKHRATKVKEAIGLNSWGNFCDYINTGGNGKLQSEMEKLTGKDYLNAFSALAEYVKPKLSRATIEGDPENPLTFKIIGMEIK